LDGKELFDHNYSYTERPTEVEAYQRAVDEARRLGLSDKRICAYLKTEWMTDDDFRRLAKAVNVSCPKRPRNGSVHRVT
jgi:HD-like signal output (HDOD) protein